MATKFIEGDMPKLSSSNVDPGSLCQIAGDGRTITPAGLLINTQGDDSSVWLGDPYDFNRA
jgi:hypothetical protein